ncbi:MAG: hypothetical protein ACI4L9_01915 [Candidatus Coproplasma sp.]
MNAIFIAVFVASATAICICSPNSFLPSLLNGAMNAAKTGLTLFCIYAVWMGISAVAEDAGINRGIAKFLQPACKKIFKCDDKTASENIAMNISCNLLGIGGAATPFAVKAVGELEKSGNTFAQNLLFIINATSIQIIPTTVIALRAAAGSANAGDITLPSLLATLVSTGLAATIYFIVNKLWHL